jgi:hypothetical protein
MDIQTRKIEFVQAFLKLQSENVIARFEKMLKTENEEFKSMSIEEFNKRIDNSLLDSKNDRVIEATELLNEIKEWR